MLPDHILILGFHTNSIIQKETAFSTKQIIRKY